MTVREEILQALLDLDQKDLNLGDLSQRTMKNPEDQGLYLEVVKGVLSHRLTLDYYINQVAKKNKKIHAPIREILRLSLYQWIYLSKIPSRAIVYEGVNLAKKYGHKGSVGFVNAVLRRLTKERLDPEKIQGKTWAEGVSLRESLPLELVEYFEKTYSREWTEAFAQASNERPGLYINLNPLKGSPQEIQASLEKEGLVIENRTTKGTGFQVIKGNPLKTPSFKKGLYYIQDQGAMEVVDFAMKSYEKGNFKLLDVCGAPGGKSIGASFINPDLEVQCCDQSPEKLEKIEENIKRLGLKNIHPLLRDGRKGLPGEREAYDLVFVDAPCSGFGLFRRKPEIKYRRGLKDVKNLSKLQGEILSRSASCVKIEGSLIYSTCTLTLEENEEVVEDFLQEYPNFYLDDQRVLLPQKGRDGFKMFRLVRKR